MRLSRDKVQQLHDQFLRNPDLSEIEIEQFEDGKIRAFTIETIEKRKPLGLKGTVGTGSRL